MRFPPATRLIVGVRDREPIAHPLPRTDSVVFDTEHVGDAIGGLKPLAQQDVAHEHVHVVGLPEPSGRQRLEIDVGPEEGFQLARVL